MLVYYQSFMGLRRQGNDASTVVNSVGEQESSFELLKSEIVLSDSTL